MANHSKFVTLAKRLIAKQGRQVTLQKLSNTATDASKPWLGAGGQVVAETCNVFAAFVPYTGNDFGIAVKDEDLVKSTDQMALVAQADVDLKDFTALLDSDGKQFKINWVQVLKPADEVILYAFGVCR